MKRYTLLVEMRCNLYCIFCGSRAIDKAVRRKRAIARLRVPRSPTEGRIERLLEYLTPGRLRTREGWRSVHGGFDREAAFAEVSEAHRKGYDALNLQGGEPTLWPWLPELVTHARSVGFPEVSVVTNGQRLAHPAYAEALFGAGLNYVTFSVVGPDAAGHDAMTLRPGSFDALLTAMDHTRAWRRMHPGLLTASANVILHAETLSGLPRIVTYLADRGIDSATFHLLRFDLFGSVPEVRERLRFPLESMRWPLAEACRVAGERGVTLDLGDVPLCLHPRITGSSIKQLQARAGSEVYQSRAPGRSHRMKGHHCPPTRACYACAVRAWCHQIPADYRDYEDALSPVDGQHLAEDYASLDPAHPRGPALIEELVSAADILEAEGVIDTGVAADIRRRARPALLARMEYAAAAGDARDAWAAFYAFLGFHAPKDPEARLPAPEAGDSAAFVAAPPLMDGTRRATLAFAPGLAVAVDVTDDGDALRLHRAVALKPVDGADPGPVARALFVQDIFGRLRDARRVRLDADTVALDHGNGLQVAWTRTLSWSVARLL